MKRMRSTRMARKGEAGYALVMIMFFLALLVLSTVVVAPTVLSGIQREKEAEMVWRGKQYVRGIRMYYMKMRRFPTSLDDLTHAKTGLRFMRQAYKDPMNTTDGSWRLIFIGPNGQLIGSLNSLTLGMVGVFGAGQQNVGPSSGLSGGTLGSVGTGASGGLATTTSTPSANPAGSSTGDASSNDPNADSSGQTGTPQSQGMMDSSNTIGGNIIGVGSKVNKKSFLWYQKAKNYRQFEFIWDPSKDMGLGGAPKGIGTPVQQNTPGTTPTQPNQNLSGTPDPNMSPPLQAPPPTN